MLDTVTFGRDWPLRTDFRAAAPNRRFRVSNLTIRIAACGTKLWAAEASLPRLLFGHNGRLIATQTELDAALAKLAQTLAPYIAVPSLDHWQPQRLDIAWNFGCSARPLVFAHASLRVPGIRRGTALYDGCRVVWRSMDKPCPVAFQLKVAHNVEMR